MTDLAFASIAEVAALLERGELSPVELTEACLERIEHLNNGAFVRTTPELARAQARAAEDEIRRGAVRGPLHGVPIAHKDCWDVAGVPTEAGSAIYRGNVPGQDGAFVRRLADAGAVTLGKTAMPELAHGDAGLANPWGPHATPGGSSTGSAIAVATGLCYAATGSDAGGSIRVPAAMCGVVGIKPTYGRVSRRGGIPHTWTLDHAGPLARTVEDAAIVLEAMAGHEPLDPSSADEPVPDLRAAARNADVAGVSVGVIRDYSFARCTEEVRRAGEECVARLGKLGADVREVVVRHLDMELPAWGTLLVAEFAAIFGAAYERHGPEAFGPIIRSELDVGRSLSAGRYLKAQQLRRCVQEAYAEALREVDVLLTAAWSTDARWYNPEVEAHLPPGTDVVVKQALGAMLPGWEPNPEAGALFFPAHNLTGLPALVMPVAFNDAGFPLGVQVVGDAFDEATVVRVAAALEADLALGVRRPPGA